MKFYQNKTTGEIIGLENMRHLITHSTEQSESLGYENHSYNVIYDMIHPNKLLGNGIKSFSITHGYLRENYKRIKKQIAYDKYPNFRQYNYNDLIQESEKLGITRLEVLQKQTY